MSASEARSYISQVEASDNEFEGYIGQIPQLDVDIKYKEIILTILTGRFGGDNFNKYSNQWPSYKKAIDEFLNHNPFYFFFDWEFQSQQGKLKEGFQWTVTKIKGEAVENLKKGNPLTRMQRNFIKGIVSYVRKETDDLTPVNPGEAPEVWSYGLFPFWSAGKTTETFAIPNSKEYTRTSAILGSETVWKGSDLEDMVLNKGEYGNRQWISSGSYSEFDKLDVTMIEEILGAAAFGGSLSQLASIDPFFHSLISGDLYGYSAVIGRFTEELGGLLKDTDYGFPLRLRDDQYKTYFPVDANKFQGSGWGTNPPGNHYYISPALYSHSNDPPGVPFIRVPKDGGGPPIVKTNIRADEVGNGAVEMDAKLGGKEHPMIEIYRREPYEFPSGLDKDLNKKFLESLQNFDKFDYGKDITKYPFKHTPDTEFSKVPSLEEESELFDYLEIYWGWVSFSSGGYLSEQNRVDKLLKSTWVRMVSEALETRNLDSSFNNKYEKYFNENLKRDILQRVLRDKEVARRAGKFKFYAELAKDMGPGETIGAPEDLEGADLAGAEAWAEGAPPPAVDPQKFGDKADIENRQKFFKQCALLLNMAPLAEKYEATIRTHDTRHGHKPYNGRFWMMKCKENQEKLMSNLISPEDGKEFFKIPPAVVSYLVPKIKIFKVENEKKDGELQETEFIFPSFADINRDKNFIKPQSTRDLRIKPFLNSDFDKGDGFGLQEFSFEFNGTNPAESRNDIKATLKLYFQSFADFIRERVSTNGKTYRFVDLVIQPSPDGGSVNGVEIIHPNQYDPSFYRLRVEVGYNYPDNMDNFYSDPDKNLKSAIERTNRSYFLCMVDHDLNVDVDGTVTVTISYRAYVESLLKSLRFDALASPELIKARKEHEARWKEILDSKECSADQLKEVRAIMAGREDKLRAETLRSIVSRLLQDGKIYVTQVNPNHAKEFRSYGSFSSGCELIGLDSEFSEVGPEAEMDSSTAGYILQNKLPKDYAYSDINDVSVQYFFFGDLLYTIMDTMMTTTESGKLEGTVEGLENTKFILGSFDFEPYVDGTIQARGLNIAYIPIALDYFMKWFTDQVIAQGETRKSFPILTFIRNLANNLLQKSMLASCANKDINKELRFMTGQISAYSTKGEPVGKLVKKIDGGGFNNIILDTDSLRSTKALPLKGDGTGAVNKVKDFYNYIVLCTYGSTLTRTGKGNYDDDVKFGRYHIDIGSNRGIVKKVSFKKSDMQYIREARFFQQGINGLLQLSNVYNATIEMFGNTLFYPGMEVFINPYGIGGTALGSPTRGPNHEGGRSIANILGLGGYHTITNVKSSFSPGDFTTTIEGYQYYSGDGEGNPNLDGASLGKKDAALKEIEEASAGVESSEACENVLRGLYSETYGFSTSDGTSVLSAGEPPFETTAIDAVDDGDEPEGVTSDGDADSINYEFRKETFVGETDEDGNPKTFSFAFVPTEDPTGNWPDWSAPDKAGEGILVNYQSCTPELNSDGGQFLPFSGDIKGAAASKMTKTKYINNDDTWTLEVYYDSGDTIIKARLRGSDGNIMGSSYAKGYYYSNKEEGLATLKPTDEDEGTE